jgi:hypothetical protein
MAGHILADTPVVMRRPLRLAPFMRRQDETGREVYRVLRPRFASMAPAALASLALAAACAILCFLWNNRRLPDRSAAAPTSRLRAVLERAAERLTRGDPEAQAGFFFALQTLARSAPHRAILAIALAAGVTLPIVTLTRTGVQPTDPATAPLGLLSIQIMVLMALAAGFRYAVTVPAELASNWTIRMAWPGDERRFVAGVKRAGIALFVIVPSLVLLPMHIALFGFANASVHTIAGILIATTIQNVMFLGYRKVPFACAYVPIQNPKLRWPASVAAFLILSNVFAAACRFGLESPMRAALLFAISSAAVLLTTFIDRVSRRERVLVNFNEGPPPTTERLRLFDQLALGD